MFNNSPPLVGAEPPSPFMDAHSISETSQPLDAPAAEGLGAQHGMQASPPQTDAQASPSSPRIWLPPVQKNVL